MGQLTVRGFDPELEAALHRLARERGISLSRAALVLMRKGAGTGDHRGSADLVGGSLDHLIGSWTEEEEREVLEVVRGCDQVDEGFWR